jgi:hypothetical protein
MFGVRVGLRRAAAAGGGAAAGCLALSHHCSPVRADSGADSLPPFDPHQSRFDQATFWGRLQQISVQLDPLKLLVRADEIAAAQALVAAFCARSRSVTPPPTQHACAVHVPSTAAARAGACSREDPARLAAGEGRAAGATDAQLWAAKELCECRVHPETGERIFTPFCFAACECAHRPRLLMMRTMTSTSAHSSKERQRGGSYMVHL